MQLEDIKIGDTVWFVEHWSSFIYSRKIKEINPPFVTISTNQGTFSSSIDKLYTSQEELLKAEKEKSEKRREKMKADINSVEDLMRFMYKNYITDCNDYVDYDAKAVVKEYAKEMLHIELED